MKVIALFLTVLIIIFVVLVLIIKLTEKSGNKTDGLVESYEAQLKTELAQKNNASSGEKKNAKNKKLIAAVVTAVAVLAVIIIAVTSGGKAKLEGTWHNDDEGNISFAENGMMFINGNSKGTWEASKDELTLYYDSGLVQVFSYDVDGDTLVMTMDGNSMLCNRVD